MQIPNCRRPPETSCNARDAGPGVQQFWQSGEDEYEFWVDVPAKALRTLIFALLKDKYEGNLEAVKELRSFCEENNVAHKFMQWFSR